MGDADRIVRPQNSIALAARLAAAGGPVGVVHYPWLDAAADENVAVREDGGQLALNKSG